MGLSTGSDPTWLIQTAHVALLNWHYLTLIPQEDSCLGLSAFEDGLVFALKTLKEVKKLSPVTLFSQFLPENLI